METSKEKQHNSTHTHTEIAPVQGNRCGSRPCLSKVPVRVGSYSSDCVHSARSVRSSWLVTISAGTAKQLRTKAQGHGSNKHGPRLIRTDQRHRNGASACTSTRGTMGICGICSIGTVLDEAWRAFLRWCFPMTAAQCGKADTQATKPQEVYGQDYSVALGRRPVEASPQSLTAAKAVSRPP